MQIAVIVNPHARRGGQAAARRCREQLPGARVIVSRSIDEARELAASLSGERLDLLLSAGGDGSAVALMNAVRPHGPHHFGLERGASDPLLFGMLPLGTGNGWANATGAPRFARAVRRLGRLARRDGLLPRRRFDLIEVDGQIGPFAGSGWDAELIDDFHAQKEGPGLLPQASRHGLAGYLHGLFTRTIPRHLFKPRVEVELVNTGAPALTVDDEGRAALLPGGSTGSVLYRGPMSVCAAGTAPEWGFGFRAFPFAGMVPGRFCMRVYGGGAAEATLRMGSLWRGAHPLSKMSSWLLTGCRASFSEPVPFQLGGDRLGHRASFEVGIARERVDVLDWSKLEA